MQLSARMRRPSFSTMSRISPARFPAPRYFDKLLQRKDGSCIEASLVASGIYGADARLTGVSLIVRDISESKRKERELARLAAIVESSGDAIVSLFLDQTIASWNRGAEKLFGFAAAEAIGQPATIFIPPQQHAPSAAVVAEIEANPGRLFSFEGPNLRKDGSVIDASMTIFGAYDRSGKLLGISSIHRDITERQRVERELATLASIVNACNDAIIGFSRELKITSWNPAAEAIYGFTAREAIGAGFDLFVPAEELARAIEADQRLFETGQPLSFEQRGQKKDGAWFVSWVSIFPIRDAAGNIVAGAGIGRDITERQRVERELATLASIVNASEDAIISVSKDLKITSWNAAAEKAYGFTAKQAIGQGLDLFVPPGELAQTIAATRHVFETGQACWEQNVQKKDGTRFVSAVNIFVTRDADGNIMEIGRHRARYYASSRESRSSCAKPHEYTAA